MSLFPDPVNRRLLLGPNWGCIFLGGRDIVMLSQHIITSLDPTEAASDPLTESKVGIELPWMTQTACLVDNEHNIFVKKGANGSSLTSEIVNEDKVVFWWDTYKSLNDV